MEEVRGGLEECVLPAEGMDCPGCASTATRTLLGLEGVRSVQPDVIGQRVKVSYDPARVSSGRLRRSLDTLGYTEPESDAPDTPPSADAEGSSRSRVSTLLERVPIHVGLGGLFWGLTVAATLLGGSDGVVAVLAAATVLAAGWRIFPPAFVAARRGILDMHVLMAVAAVGALLIGEFVEAGAVLFLFAVAQDLEHRTLRRARREVRSLMDLAPLEATVLRHGHHVRVPVEAVRPGELVLVRPGERVPVDGTVVSGSSDVDASAITGEPIPEAKFRDDKVFAGSVNGSGALEVVCDRTAANSALGRILRSIEEARSKKSRTEAFVDRFARVYTPIVMAGALLVAVLPPLVGGGPWGEWGYRALVLVVIACPCALVISTPVTVVSALTGAVRRGMLVKSGVHLEVLGKTRVVALDKTGTLTEGAPRVSRVVSWNGGDASELLRHAAAAESHSEHPIARAILDEARASGLALGEGIEMTALPGRGARARLDGRSILVGSPRLFREEGLLDEEAEARIAEIESEGSTVVLAGWGNPSEPVSVRGALLLTDTLRPGVSALIEGLRGQGVRRIVCMSGDRRASVETAIRAVAPDGGRIDEWKGDLLPEEKVSWISELRAAEGPVLMVGDGVNDAPALAAADVGMAMGAGGTGVAVDAADIALMEDDLSRIPEAFRLGRKAARIIRANIGFALAVKIVFVTLGSLGLATLWMAVVADMGSSLAVILNGLRALHLPAART